MNRRMDLLFEEGPRALARGLRREATEIEWRLARSRMSDRARTRLGRRLASLRVMVAALLLLALEEREAARPAA